MKKTLIALLAAASCAMGATWTEYDVAATVDTTGVDFSTNAMSVAVTLNVDVIKGYFQSAEGTSNMIIKVTGNNAMGVGTLVKSTEKEYFSAAWNDTIDYTPSGIDIDMGREDLWTDATKASLVFSAGQTTGARVVFTMAYADGSTWQTVGTASSVKSSSWAPSGIELNTDAVTSVSATNSYVTLDDAKAKGVALVPEPATATLSLLALAGLAARRRR